MTKEERETIGQAYDFLCAATFFSEKNQIAVKATVKQIKEMLHKYSMKELDRLTQKTQSDWVGLTNDELTDLFYNKSLGQESAVGQAIALLRERNEKTN